MKEWRINLAYKLILFVLFLISPFFVLKYLNGENLFIENYIIVYLLELCIFVFSYAMYEVRVRSFYNRLVKKINMLNDKYDIKNSKFSKFLGLDSFSSFEYFFNEELDKVFSELDNSKSLYTDLKENKGTESEVNKTELQQTIFELTKIKEFEEMERDLLKKGTLFLNEIKKSMGSNFFEELGFYLDKYFSLANLVLGQKTGETYKVYNKLSDESDLKINYIHLEELDCGIYTNHRINEIYNFDLIFVIKVEEKYIGFIMFNVSNKELIKQFRIMALVEELYNVLLLTIDFYLKQKSKDEKIEKLTVDIKKLNNQLMETDENLDVHLEQMSNMYEEIVTLYEVGKKLGKIYEKHNIEKTILDTLIEITNTEFAIVYEKVGENFKISKIENLKDKKLINEFREAEILKEMFLIMKKVAKPIIINDVKKYEGYKNFTAHMKATIKNFVEAPIFNNEEVKGGVILFNKNEEFTAANINLITSLINQMSIAVQNVDYFKNEIEREKEEEQLKIASSIQAKLFPQKMPNYEKIEVFGTNVPAKAVGGDYYDLVKVDDNTLIGFIADVSGKGMPAALLVSMVRTIFRMVVEEFKEHSPELILERINSVLLKEDLEGRFITGLCFKYIEDKEILEVSSAGHDPFIIYRTQEKKMYTYPSDSIVLGVMEDTYEKQLFNFSKDDIGIFYTDGVVEARRENGDFYGLEKLFETIEKNLDSSAKDIGEAIYKDLKDFTKEARQNDDITILIAKGV